MPDDTDIIHSINDFCQFYGISRPRLTRIIEDALRDHSGVFALESFGFFQAHRPGPAAPMEIRKYYPTRHEEDSIRPLPLRGDARSPLAILADCSTGDQAQSSTPAPPAAASSSMPAPSSARSNLPTERELKLRILEERAAAMHQKNVLEQARLRDETVSYCAAAVQIILKSLRSDIDSLCLDSTSSNRLRASIDASLADLQFVIPAIIDAQPLERIELELSARRAERLAAPRPSSAQSPQPQSATPQSTPSQSTLPQSTTQPQTHKP